MSDRCLEPRARPASGCFVDPRIIDACQRGDQGALGELFEACHWRVRSLARLYGGSDSLTNDITQDVFLAVFKGIGQFRHEARFETWLHRIVINACLKEHRRRKSLLPLIDESRLAREALEQSREARLLRRELASEVRAAVAALRPKLRAPLVMKHVSGLSYDEIGVALGCSTGTVASRLNRARAALAGKLAHLRGVYAGD